MNPLFPPYFFTSNSKFAKRLRVIPKTLKNPSQKDLASASSDFSFSHSLENSIALDFISFQDSDIIFFQI
ncbi:MAG: hypothetical protein PHW24_01015 [Candidatus Moranbacteria bacterium]|nr:hypothetical protein [Candidatus Moranbacteria bacterium]